MGEGADVDSQIGVQIELRADRPVHGGAVLATSSDGRRIFLRGAAPGELVLAQVSAEHKTYSWADTIRVLEPSPDRVTGIWPEATAAGAGGLELAHLTPAAQRTWKEDVLAEQIRRIGGPGLSAQVQKVYPDGVPVEEPQARDSGLSSTEEEVTAGTRRRIQLTGMEDGGLGVRRYRSHDLVAVDRVPVAVTPIDDLRLIVEDPLGVWKSRWADGDRIAIEAPTDSDAVVITPGGTYRFADGAPVEPVGTWSVGANGVTHLFHVTSGGFWQAHTRAPSTLVSAVLEAAEPRPGQIIFELYSGAGLFSKFLADAVAPEGQVLTLEGSKRAVADAHRNLATEVDSGVVETYTGQVEANAIAELQSAAKGPVDTVVLDPPRKGAAKGVLAAIAKTSANKVVLVSCDPAAGARDMRALVDSGFQLARLRAWDLFPHSHHFETVAELVRDEQSSLQATV